MPSSHNPGFELTQEAQEDFRDIITYTIETWGEEQALDYKEKLNKGFRLIQENPFIGHKREDILPEYRALLVEKHLIIYWPTTQSVKVVRILHVNRDVGGVTS